MSIHFVGINNQILIYFTWARSWRRDHPAIQLCHQSIAKPDNKTVQPSWPTHVNNRYLISYAKNWNKNKINQIRQYNRNGDSIMNINNTQMDLEQYAFTGKFYIISSRFIWSFHTLNNYKLDPHIFSIMFWNYSKWGHLLYHWATNSRGAFRNKPMI